MLILFVFSLLKAFFAILRSFLRLLISLHIAGLDLAQELIKLPLLIRRQVRDLPLVLPERFAKMASCLEVDLHYVDNVGGAHVTNKVAALHVFDSPKVG